MVLFVTFEFCSIHYDSAFSYNFHLLLCSNMLLYFVQLHVIFAAWLRVAAVCKQQVYRTPCVCVCVYVCVYVFTSIHCEGFICLDQLEYQGTDQRCCVENVSFLCQVLSSLLQNEAPNLTYQPLYPVYTIEAAKATI